MLKPILVVFELVFIVPPSSFFFWIFRQSMTKNFAKGSEIYKLQSSPSAAINVKPQVHLNWRLHGCYIDCGGKVTQIAWKSGLAKIFCQWL